MKRKSILVYIEGEGGGEESSSKSRHLAGAFRKSWHTFLQPLADLARSKGISLQCVIGHGGSEALKKFSRPLPDQFGALRILLIDSEGPVTDVNKPWSALPVTKRPDWADDKQCYLMVQCLETWLLADWESIRNHYNKSKPCFRENHLKAWPSLEATDRKNLQRALEAATANCNNPYFHAYGNVLIAVVRREKLKVLPSVARLFRDLEIKVKEYAA